MALVVCGYEFVDRDELKRLRLEAQHLKTVTRDLKERTRHLHESRALVRELQSENDKMKKDDPMSDTVWTSFGLSVEDDAEGTYEVVRLDTGKFLECKGFKTAQEAAEKADELAKIQPGVQFGVFGLIRTYEADIPVVSEDVIHELSPAKPKAKPADE